jgi:hypothetical protein
MEKYEGGAKKPFFVYWTILFVYVASFLILSQLIKPAGEIMVRDFFYAITGVTTVIVLTTAAIKSQGADKPVWSLIAIAGICWSLGDVIMRVCELTGIFGPVRTLCVADVFYQIAYISLAFVVVNLARLTNDRKIHADWARFYPLALFITVTLISTAMAYFLPNGLAGELGARTGLRIEMIVNYIYPALDFGIVAGLLLILFTHRIPFRKTWHEVLIFGLSIFTVADISYSLFKPAGIYDPASLPTQVIMAIWLTSYGVMIMAAVYKLNET